MEQEPYRAVEEEFAVLFRRARAMSLDVAREVHPELEADAYGLLVHLDRTGPARVTDLAGAIGVGKGTISRQIRALEQLGLVERKVDPADGRAFLLKLTQVGQGRFRAARDARRDRMRSLMHTWPRQDVVSLAGLLHRFNQLPQ
jgi:DNA-binding MarR family transcriptional regulator